MDEPFQQRMTERKVYEEIVNVIVNMAVAEFSQDEAARLRIYELVADNFAGMARVLKKPESATMLSEIEHGRA